MPPLQVPGMRVVYPGCPGPQGLAPLSHNPRTASHPAPAAWVESVRGTAPAVASRCHGAAASGQGPPGHPCENPCGGRRPVLRLLPGRGSGADRPGRCRQHDHPGSKCAIGHHVELAPGGLHQPAAAQPRHVGIVDRPHGHRDLGRRRGLEARGCRRGYATRLQRLQPPQ
ncbi:hypothetical protein D3C79_847190 [compost metagenome]